MANDQKPASIGEVSSFVLRYFLSAAHSGNFWQRQNPGKDIDRFGILQLVHRDRAVDRKPARLRSPQILEMGAATESLADVVGIGPDIKAFAANDGEIDFGQRDSIDRITIDVNEPRFALHRLALP